MTDDPILEFEEELRRAQLAGDAAALDRLLDDELVFTGIDGRLYTKADDLATQGVIVETGSGGIVVGS